MPARGSLIPQRSERFLTVRIAGYRARPCRPKDLLWKRYFIIPTLFNKSICCYSFTTQSEKRIILCNINTRKGGEKNDIRNELEQPYEYCLLYTSPSPR